MKKIIIVIFAILLSIYLVYGYYSLSTPYEIERTISSFKMTSPFEFYYFDSMEPSPYYAIKLKPVIYVFFTLLIYLLLSRKKRLIFVSVGVLLLGSFVAFNAYVSNEINSVLTNYNEIIFYGEKYNIILTELNDNKQTIITIHYHILLLPATIYNYLFIESIVPYITKYRKLMLQ